MALSYRWLSIRNSFPLDRNGELDDKAVISDWQSLSNSFIAEVKIESDRQYDIRVDAFPFLYQLLYASAELARAGEFHVEVGEGLRLHGVPEGNQIEIRIAFEAGSRNDILLRQKLSSSNASLFLCLKAAELAQSLEEIGVDLERYLSIFSIYIYRLETL